MTALVSPAWLAEQMAAQDLLLFDASWYLPTERRDARELYRHSHLPGARFFDIDAIVDRDSNLPHMAPTAAQFERLIGQLGIGNRHRLVFYDQQGVYSAPRAWWLMRLFGHADCAVLDGGLPRWQREGRPTEQGDVPSTAVTQYRARFNARLLRGVGDMLENLRSAREIVLDARPRARFYAQVPEPRPGLRSGHIPGSHSLPFTAVLNADQTLKSPVELRALFAAHGIDADSRVVTSCGSGLTAAVLNLALEVAGLPDGALYDGSWAEWGARDDTPVETG